MVLHDGDQAGRADVRGRGRPARSTERILRAALDLLDEQGADALTFRAVAERIKGSTATLYRHFGDRAELARRIVDLAYTEITLDDARLAAGWDDAIGHIAEELFGLLLRHRGLAPLMLEEVPSGPHARALRQTFRSTLRREGFTEREATLAYATVARFILGLGIQLGTSAEHPADVPAGDAVGSISLREEFAYGLRLMIIGLREQRAPGTER